MTVGKQACFSNIPKVLFTLTHLSPLGESVVSAASFNKVKDKAQFLHGGYPELVRIQRRVSRKRYLGSKQVYEYERMSLDIPRKFHSKVKPFLKQDLNMDLSIKGSYLVITLTPAKTFRHAEYAPQKSAPERLQTLEF
jgi:hypothetical protein